MSNFIELFKEMDINNVIFLIALSIGTIVIFAGCMRPFSASSIEILFMNKEDELRRTSLTYVIMFFLFGVINYLFITDSLPMVLCRGAVILMPLIYIVLWIINETGKGKSVFPWYKERFGITFIVIFFPLIAYECSIITGVKAMGCAVLCALAEIIFMAIIYLNPMPRKSDVSIKINNVEWYVFRRLDDEHFLCGDSVDITKCTKIKVLEYDAMVQNNIFLKKKNAESK